MNAALENLRAEMIAAGVDPGNASIVADSNLHRFMVVGDPPRSKNGWYQIHDNHDGTYGGTFGCHKRQIRQTWFSGRPHRELSAEERRQYAAKMAADRRRLAEAEALRHRQTEEKASAILKQTRPADPDHLYLQKKDTKRHGLRQRDDALVVPIRDAAGTLTSLQFIGPDGTKRFLSGGKIAGCYHSIGKPPAPGEPLLIAEGWATAATLFEATGHACACAFSAVNLRPVAEALHRKYPTIQIVIAADADPVGRKAAAEAAEAVGGQWIAPDFSESEQ